MASGQTYIFTGGGTGGHLFPGIAVACELLKGEHPPRILFVGSDRGLEANLFSRYQLNHHALGVESLRTLTRHPWKFLTRNWRAWREARELIRNERPAVVVGLGGFASAPVAWEASRAGIPIVLLEQNVIPGRTTRWLARRASAVCVSFEGTVRRLSRKTRVEVTGNPVRQEIRDLYYQRTVASSEFRQLLVLGGSQGADSLNEAVLAAVRALRKELAPWKIVHQTGPRQVDSVRGEYNDLAINCQVEPFFDDLPRHYRNASLVISRAGATTLAELACAGLPMILLPYPQSADDHQKANAQLMQDEGAALLVEHRATADATGQELANHLRTILTDSAKLASLGTAARELARPDSTVAVADLIRSLSCPKGQ